MNNDEILQAIHEILQAIQDHGDWGFVHGYCAAIRDIHINNRTVLAEMPEALKRMKAFQRIEKLLMQNKNIINFKVWQPTQFNSE
jgi:hypothetical protein